MRRKRKRGIIDRGLRIYKEAHGTDFLWEKLRSRAEMVESGHK